MWASHPAAGKTVLLSSHFRQRGQKAIGQSSEHHAEEQTGSLMLDASAGCSCSGAQSRAPGVL